MSEDAEFLISGPEEVTVAGRDARAYRWFIAGHPVLVEFSETAIEVGSEGISTRAERALESQGKSEMIEFLGWRRPPDKVLFTTDNWPSIEGGDRGDEGD